MIWTDTFANNRQSSIFNTTLSENNARLAELNRQDIRVIIGNPPYSVGQDNANDDNQNEHYEELDGRIAATYAARTEATLKNSLYDSYIRAYRWASDRIGEKGIIGFVTNAGWIDSNSADGMRKCLAEEFSAIYIYHLKGNQRTSGERSRQEGGKVFGEGSRAPVAIVFLVKNPETTEHGKIYFHAVGDYLTRDEKLAELKRNVSIAHTQVNEIVPDAHGDWLNQRDDSYARFMRVDGKKASENSIFKNYSRGVATSRDAWVYGSNKRKVLEHVANSITFYNSQVKALAANPNYEIDLDPKKMKWDRLQKNTILRGKIVEDVSVSKLYLSYYRPFFTQYLYLDRFWNNCVYQMPAIFPTCESKKLLICSSGVGPKGLCPSGLPTLAAVRLGGWGLRSLRSLRSQPQSQRLGRSGSVKGLSRHILRRCAPCGIPRPLDPASTRNGIRSRAGAEAAALERSGRDRVSTRRSEPLT